jgi:hypothetical protein
MASKQRTIWNKLYKMTLRGLSRSRLYADAMAYLEYGKGIVQTGFVLGIITREERRKFFSELEEAKPFVLEF